jgi:hypothetical protein
MFVLWVMVLSVYSKLMHRYSLTNYFYVIIIVRVIFNVFVHTYHDNLYHKYLLCIYVLPENGLRRPKHVREITTIIFYARKFIISGNKYIVINILH